MPSFTETGPHNLPLQSVEQVRHDNLGERAAELRLHPRVRAEALPGVRRPELGQVDLLRPPQPLPEREVLLVPRLLPEICRGGPAGLRVLRRGPVLLRFGGHRPGELQLQRAVAGVGHGKNRAVFLFERESAP